MEHPRALEHPGATDGTLGRDGSGEDRQGSNGTVKMEWGKVRCDGPWGHRDPNPAPRCKREHPQGPRHILGLGWRRRSPHSLENSHLPNHGTWEQGDPAAFGASQRPPRALAVCVGVPRCPPCVGPLAACCSLRTLRLSVPRTWNERGTSPAFSGNADDRVLISDFLLSHAGPEEGCLSHHSDWDVNPMPTGNK